MVLFLLCVGLLVFGIVLWERKIFQFWNLATLSVQQLPLTKCMRSTVRLIYKIPFFFNYIRIFLVCSILFLKFSQFQWITVRWYSRGKVKSVALIKSRNFERLMKWVAFWATISWPRNEINATTLGNARFIKGRREEIFPREINDRSLQCWLWRN